MLGRENQQIKKLLSLEAVEKQNTLQDKNIIF